MSQSTDDIGVIARGNKPVKKRYIGLTIIAICLIAIIALAATFIVNKKSSPEAQPTQCETDMDTIQEALDAYHNTNDEWPTADGLTGDIVWDELVPQYMSEMPLIDGSCDWRVGADPEGEVCIGHWC